MNNNEKDVGLIIGFAIGILIWLGGLVFGIVLLKTSVLLGIAIFLVPQVYFGLYIGFALAKRPVKKWTKVNSFILTGYEIVNTGEQEDAGDAFAGIEGDWWDNCPADTADFHYEIGLAKEKTEAESREKAVQSANGFIAQYIGPVKIWTTNQNDAEQSEQYCFAKLINVKYEYHLAEDGTCYVLGALPLGPYKKKKEEEEKETFEKKAEAADIMTSAIDKYFK